MSTRSLQTLLDGMTPEVKQQLLQLMVSEQQASGAAAHSSSSPERLLLPCFNLVCSGTCAYGPKCMFLHDPRLLIPKHLRRRTEFLLQSHLHTYRPNRGGACSGNGSDTDSTGSGSSVTHRKDDVFQFPYFNMSSHTSNMACYDIPVADEECTRDEQFAVENCQLEFSMWYQLIAALNDRSADTYLRKTPLYYQKSRLPVFQKLAV